MWPNLQFHADLVTFTEEILSGKLHFLCNVWKQTNKKISAAQRGSEYGNMMDERRRQPSTGQVQIICKQRSQYRARILYTGNAVCVHVRCTVVTVHAICEGLTGFFCEFCKIFQNDFFCRTPPSDYFWVEWWSLFVQC